MHESVDFDYHIVVAFPSSVRKSSHKVDTLLLIHHDVEVLYRLLNNPPTIYSVSHVNSLTYSDALHEWVENY